MARKTRRQKQRSAARQTAPARAPGTRPDQSIGSTSSFSLTGGADLAPSETDGEAVAEEAESIEALADAAAVPATADPGAAAPSPPRATAPGRRAAAAPVAPAGAAPRRRIERLSQTTPVATRAGRPGRGPSAAAMFQPLDTEDAAIPFDRVPYVPADLRRVLVIALMMVALIIIAAIVVTHVVH